MGRLLRDPLGVLEHNLPKFYHHNFSLTHFVYAQYQHFLHIKSPSPKLEEFAVQLVIRQLLQKSIIIMSAKEILTFSDLILLIDPQVAHFLFNSEAKSTLAYLKL